MIIEWSEEKNKTLKKERGLSFELVLEAIEAGRILDDSKHPNDKYNHQRVLVVEVDGYPVMVPYVESGDKFFLRTMFHNRRLKRED